MELNAARVAPLAGGRCPGDGPLRLGAPGWCRREDSTRGGLLGSFRGLGLRQESRGVCRAEADFRFYTRNSKGPFSLGFSARC